MKTWKYLKKKWKCFLLHNLFTEKKYNPCWGKTYLFMCNVGIPASLRSIFKSIRMFLGFPLLRELFAVRYIFCQRDVLISNLMFTFSAFLFTASMCNWSSNISRLNWFRLFWIFYYPFDSCGLFEKTYFLLMARRIEFI